MGIRVGIDLSTTFSAVSMLDPDFTRVGIVAFADKTEVVLSPTDDFNAVRRAISKLESVDVGGGTSAEPFSDAYNLLRGGLFIDKRDVRYIVVLTDGGWFTPEDAIASARICHRKGIDIMDLGFGSPDYTFLKKIASNDEFASMTDLSQLGGSFSKIA